jgi:acyl carrier protein
MPFPAAVGLDSNLFDELGFDSILLLDLIVSIEQECACQFSDEDLSMDSLSTPRKLLELIARRSGARGDA